MKSTTSDQQFFGANNMLPAPHFDDEATVLSARPVVPLAAVGTGQAKSSFPRPWMLGVALVGSLLVGIFATAIYYSSINRVDSALFDKAAVAAGVEASASKSEAGFSGPVATQPAVNAETPAEVWNQAQAKGETVKPAAGQSTKAVARRRAVIAEGRSSDQEMVESRENLQAARKQGKQARRQAEREKRDVRSDDLLRIREIFEGAPRP